MPRPPSRFSHRTRGQFLVIALAALLGLGLMPGRFVTAQVDGNTYTNPTYRYQLQWDPDVWSVPDDGSGDLTLESDQVQFYLQSGQFYSGDATACRDDLVARLPDDPTVTSSQPYEGDGDLAGETDGRAYATLEVDLAETDDQPARTVAERIDCRTVVAGEAVLAITWLAPSDTFQEASDLTDTLLDNLVIPSFQVPGATVPNIEGETYTDPDFGFTVDWTGSDWFAFNPVDAIFGLNDETSLVTFDLPDEFDGDPASCVEQTLADLASSPGIVDASPIEVDGEEIAGMDDAGWSFAAVDANYGGAEQFVEVRCAALPGQTAVIRAVHSGPIADYEAEAELAAPIFASLMVVENPGDTSPDAGEATPVSGGTPEVRPAATPAVPQGTPAASESAATPASATDGDLTTFRAGEDQWGIAYDASVWLPLDPALYATVDLALGGASLIVTFETAPTNGAEPQDVLDATVESEIFAVAGDATGVEQLDGPPTGTVDGSVGAAYQLSTTAGTEVVEGLLMIPLDAETVVVVRIYTTPQGYVDGFDALDGLLGGLEG